MKTRLLLTTTLFLATTLVLPAAAANALDYEILGVGGTSCGAWTAARRAMIGTGTEADRAWATATAAA